ncbi:lysoplasmalogenase [Corynebacterium sp. ES2730-CONJ]|uniref:lysoplasmalogenase n=1 Tax=Corynebacterium sp. ES2730-CONJ TaxID=2973941 RepID=UPI00216B5C71|nr:lysoplasmalogenase [Corynebacterium sp. ES2730-CONJ]MCS4532106.1 lysoplasmalogenase [Corynebacterium sp. ES2730-CONJ]
MNKLAALSLAATGACALAKLTSNRPLEKISKPIIVPALMLSEPTRLRDPLFAIGGIGHFLGDLELMRDHASLHKGAALFGLGHLAHIARAIKEGKKPKKPLWHLAALGVAAPLVKDPRLIAYAALLATYSSLESPSSGAIFMLSDALIAINRAYPRPYLDASVLATYGVAQNFLYRSS